MLLLELLNHEENWTQGTYATDVWGNRVSAHASVACRWCLREGLKKCYASDANAFYAAEDKLRQTFRRLHPEYRWGYLVWQDMKSRTFAEIRQLLEAAGV